MKCGRKWRSQTATRLGYDSLDMAQWQQLNNEIRRKEADSVFLSISTDNGHHTNYTIQIENHSKIDIEVRCISLWSQGQKVSKDAFPPENGWPVPAQRSVLIQFDAQEDVAYRLWQQAGKPEISQGGSRQFRAEVVVVLRCEILGLERNFEEAQAVQVDFLNRQVT